MKALRLASMACMLVAAQLGSVALAASTTNYTDQWWNEQESGWGAAVEQQADVLFVVLYVYGPDGAPRWFSAAAFRQPTLTAGNDVFVGDLYQTSGPYFAAAWSSAPLTERKVGSLTFDASGIDRATLSYSVDGTAVARSVTRQTWARGNLSGYYYVGWNAGCGEPWRTIFDAPSLAIISQDGAAITISIRRTDVPDPGLDFAGVYRQTGHLGEVVAGLTAGGSGTATFLEIAKTRSGFTARLAGTVTTGGVACPLTNGRIGGVLVDQ